MQKSYNINILTEVRQELISKLRVVYSGEYIEYEIATTFDRNQTPTQKVFKKTAFTVGIKTYKWNVHNENSFSVVINGRITMGLYDIEHKDETHLIAPTIFHNVEGLSFDTECSINTMMARINFIYNSNIILSKTLNDVRPNINKVIIDDSDVEVDYDI